MDNIEKNEVGTFRHFIDSHKCSELLLQETDITILLPEYSSAKIINEEGKVYIYFADDYLGKVEITQENGVFITFNNGEYHLCSADDEPDLNAFDIAHVSLLENDGDVFCIEIGNLSGNGITLEFYEKVEDPFLMKKNVICKKKEGVVESTNGEYYGVSFTGGGSKGFNEDAILITEDYMVVCDGVGGYKNADLANYTAVKFSDRYLKKWDVCKDFFKDLRERFSFSQMGFAATTIVAVKKYNDALGDKVKFTIGNVGDSKAYAICLSERRIVASTKDQSFVQSKIDAGQLTEVARYFDENKHIVSNLISAQKFSMAPEIIEVSGKKNDMLVVACSDGVSDFVTPEEILDLVMSQYKLDTIERNFSLLLWKAYGKDVNKFDSSVRLNLKSLCEAIYSLAFYRQYQASCTIKLNGVEHNIGGTAGDNITVGALF